MIIVPVGALISMSYIKPWSIKFGIPAIFTTAATLVYVSGSCHYSREPPKGSPFTTVFRVICAATSKMFIGTGRLYERVKRSDDDPTLFLAHTNDLRFLDKAATFVPNQHPEKQKRNRWRLCRVTEVEETKLVIRSIGICSFFIICGLVSAIGHTYFISQANHLKRKKFPLLLLPYFCDVSKSDYRNLFFSIKSSSKYHPPIGIGISMILAIICCIVAAKVETKRLHVVARYGLFDKPEAEIPLSITHLIPQFMLLGALDGVFEQSVASFFKKQVPDTMTPYMAWLSEGIRGVGIISSVLSVFVVGKISQSDGKPSWFQDTLNRSRLDRYYMTLAVLVSVNLVFYGLVAFRFKWRDSLEFENPESSRYQETVDEIKYEDPDDLISNLGG
ncbi:protein NRT1/ PTR FAMILY 5.5-like [Hibiscus syriacus]|nr:protein NRT1/ PTR FAMILY 5.5-like [Hibiscus syriacus]